MRKIKSMLSRNRQKLAPKFDAFIQSKPILVALSVFNWPRKQIRRLYGWVVGWAETKNAERALGAIALAESSFFPIPPDPLLIAMTTAHPKKWLRFTIICTAASVVGGVIGYLIGIGLFETVGRWVVDTYHLQAEFDMLGQRFSENAFLTVVTAGFTPIPFKLITISAGVFQVNFLVFLISAILGRAGRFFLVGWLMYQFGRRYKDKIERYVDVLGLLFVLLIVLGFVVMKLLI